MGLLSEYADHDKRDLRLTIEWLTAERDQARSDATDARVAEHHWSDACHDMHMKYGEQLVEVERLTALGNRLCDQARACPGRDSFLEDACDAWEGR